MLCKELRVSDGAEERRREGEVWKERERKGEEEAYLQDNRHPRTNNNRVAPHPIKCALSLPSYSSPTLAPANTRNTRCKTLRHPGLRDVIEVVDDPAR